MPQLFDPLTIRSVTIRNRIGVSPMCQYSSEQGFATDWHLVHLGARAAGGAGLVMMEATAIEARGRISPGDNGIWLDEHIPQLQRISAFIKSQGSVPAIQLAHAGRKASRSVPREGDYAVEKNAGGWDIVGPSALAFDQPDFKVPHSLTESDIASVVQAFGQAARRSREAGFEMVELHAAHGYLAHSFFSPLANQRVDQYGGSFANRARFILEATRAIRQEWPEHLPMAVRLSCSDWAPGGVTIEDSVALAQLLQKEAVDLIDCSSGGLVAKATIPVGSGYQVPFAEAIRSQTSLKTAAVGMITEAMQADELVRNGRTDLVFLARELLRDPHWPLRAAGVVHQLHKVKAGLVPKQYLRAY